MILATVNTGHFDWTVVAASSEAAIEALLAAYTKHAEGYRGDADPALMASMLADGEVTFTPITLGVALRDGRPIN